MIKVENLTFFYSKLKILDDLNFTIERSEIVALIGVSGSGKTTLFRLMTGIIQPQEGSIFIQNLPLPEGNRWISYMSQEDLLLPWRTVLANVLLVGELGSSCKNDLEQRALELLETVGLAGCEKLMPHELSGGMKQRVSLVRALLQDRPLLLLDEPFGPLDVILREELYTLLRRVRNQYGKTILLVTHDFRDAWALADRILILANHHITHDIQITERENPIKKEALMTDIRFALSQQPLVGQKA